MKKIKKSMRKTCKPVRKQSETAREFHENDRKLAKQFQSTMITAILRRFLSPRGRSGIVREPFGGHFGSFGGRSGAVPRSFGGCVGVDGSRSGPFQGHSGVVRDSFGGPSAVVRGSFEIFSKNFRKKIRKNLDIYFVRSL